MGRWKRLLSLILALALTASYLPAPIQAEEIPEELAEEVVNTTAVGGTCGENVIWILDEEGTLTISGTGEMDMEWMA